MLSYPPLNLNTMNKTIGNDREVINFTGKRIRYHSTLSLDQVLVKLRARVGETTVDNIVQLSALPGTREEFEKKVQQYVGDSGFMLFAQMDHGRWIEKFAIKRRLLRWIIGNPLIAITMIRHDYTAGLFLPIELLVAEGDDGVGCNITYVLPSSLIVVDANPQLLSAAQALDGKIETLVATAVTSKE
jgi:uncharacterized protein (DUF302 family)